LQYLAPGLTLGQTTITTGQAVTFFPRPGTRLLEVVRPDGGVEQLKSPFPPFTDTSRPGLYSVQEAGAPAGGVASARRQTAFAVNFFPARPAPAGGPATVHAGQVQPGKTLIASIPISIIWPFEVAALILLAVEWWISFRGTRLL
ncbi:MAG: hypothetical protein M3Z66_08975, partial [Chloroflexota bacterium]|nr:hypothetical protein [Chloroflexota bacterium]